MTNFLLITTENSEVFSQYIEQNNSYDHFEQENFFAKIWKYLKLLVSFILFSIFISWTYRAIFFSYFEVCWVFYKIILELKYVSTK